MMPVPVIKSYVPSVQVKHHQSDVGYPLVLNWPAQKRFLVSLENIGKACVPAVSC